MFWSRDNHSNPSWVTSIFFELPSAMGALQALNASGFEDDDIELIAVLSGKAPDLTVILHHLGIPAYHAECYNECFEHGAVLLIVRTIPSGRRKTALRLLEQHGGIFPELNSTTKQTYRLPWRRL